MEGNVVKAAWILGGSIVLSVVIFGVGAIFMVVWFSRASGDRAERISERAAQAVIEAATHTHVTLNASEQPIKVALDASQPLRVGFDGTTPVKVGFENKLPMALRVENSLDEEKGTRAPLVLKLNP